MNRFNMIDTPIEGLRLIERQQRGDTRGFLTRLFCADELKAVGWHFPVAQINHTLTQTKGTVRGMHFQHQPHAEAKLVSCLRGEIWDVALDLRPNSITFLRWHAERLSADNHRALLIPKGFAHGFQLMTDDAELIYVHSNAYHASSEAGIYPLDPSLNIQWPLPIAQLSERDRTHPLISDAFTGVIV
jgi:dTDP-4-dehydrorhamnose 3,5-epimerase